MTQQLSLTAFYVCASLLFSGCSSSIIKNEMSSKQEDLKDHIVVDARDQKIITLDVRQKDKIALILRDIATTSYFYLEPRYSSTALAYEGITHCCFPKKLMMGNSGNIIYKFNVLQEGQTSIEIIARHKGLSSTLAHEDTDIRFLLKLQVN